MAELLTKLVELKSLPPELHWFCPRSDRFSQHTDNTTYKEHESVKVESSITSNVEHRRGLVNECLQLFAYDDSTDLVPFQDYLVNQIDRQLGKCEICILEYYRSKRQMIEDLR
ncbi:MAG: hypothetical protein Q9190_005673, partial [Brigantiaea leucoxantha]